MLVAIDTAVGLDDHTLTYTYGVHDRYMWAGDALGFAEGVRAHLYEVLDSAA
ncbi:MAG: hypothetical protein R2939_12915 [Kofleriaceae bacterium]